MYFSDFFKMGVIIHGYRVDFSTHSFCIIFRFCSTLQYIQYIKPSSVWYKCLLDLADRRMLDYLSFPCLQVIRIICSEKRTLKMFPFNMLLLLLGVMSILFQFPTYLFVPKFNFFVCLIIWNTVERARHSYLMLSFL